MPGPRGRVREMGTQSAQIKTFTQLLQRPHACTHKTHTREDIESSCGTAMLGACELKLQPEVHFSLAT